MYVKRNTNVLKPKATRVANVFRTLGSPVESHVVNGISHPPKKSVAMSADAVTMLEYSAMCSPSAYGRSNGNRLVSARALIKKITNDTDNGTMNHACAACCWAITCDSVTLPASRSTATVLKPNEISYEIIWADARKPPSREYLLLDAQPASTMPYTPSELIARI